MSSDAIAPPRGKVFGGAASPLVGRAARFVGGSAALTGLAGFGFTLVALAVFMWALLPKMVSGAYHFADGTPLFIIWPFLFSFIQLKGWAFAAWVCAVVLGITTCLAWLLAAERKRIMKDVADFLARGGAARLPKSSLGGVLAAFLAVGLFDLLYAAFLVIVGGDLGDPLAGIDQFWRIAYLLANASIWEEVVGRVMLIGAPLLILDLLYRRPGALRRLWGRYDRLDASFWLLAVYSSVLFGIAHASGWTWWKVPPTLFAGLFFAWLYGKYGLHAAVALHFAFDFLSIPLLMVEGAELSVGVYAILLGYLAFAGCVALAVLGIVSGLAVKRLGLLDEEPAGRRGEGSQ